MRPFFAFIGGFAAALGIFGAGAAVAVAFLVAEPARHQAGGQNITELWSAEPREVDTAAQDFQRVQGNAAATASETGDAQAAGAESDAEEELPPDGVDRVTTAALPSTEASSEIENEIMAPEADPRGSAQWQEAAARHTEWCADQYRSYRPRDDSYTPYSGGRRPCVSPYSAELDGLAVTEAGASMAADPYQAEQEVSAPIQYAADEEERAGQPSSDHVSYCFSRYRSYRPEDNTYQPYGGGPRRQCR